MKLFHLSDLHIGIKLYNYNMKEDQEYILNQIILYVKEYKPDCVIIAGDIYNKSIPSAESVGIFGDFLARLSSISEKLQIMIIAGNHDSAERIVYAADILKKQNIHIVGTPPKTQIDHIYHIELNDEYGLVNFYLLPFVKPIYVRGVFEEEILSYEESIRKLIERENIDFSQRNVLISHQYYEYMGEKLERMSSEVTTVGNIDSVDSSIIEQFDYVALGHIHKPMKVGKSHIRYCGTPLEYSVDEENQKKGIMYIELLNKDNPIVYTKIPLKPLREIQTIQGNINTILSHDIETNENYVVIELTDEEDIHIIDMMDKIRNKFPYLLCVKRSKATGADTENLQGIAMEKYEPYEMFDTFANELGSPLSKDEAELLKVIMNEVKGEL